MYVALVALLTEEMTAQSIAYHAHGTADGDKFCCYPWLVCHDIKSAMHCLLRLAPTMINHLTSKTTSNMSLLLCFTITSSAVEVAAAVCVGGCCYCSGGYCGTERKGREIMGSRGRGQEEQQQEVLTFPSP